MELAGMASWRRKDMGEIGCRRKGEIVCLDERNRGVSGAFTRRITSRLLKCVASYIHKSQESRRVWEVKVTKFSSHLKYSM